MAQKVIIPIGYDEQSNVYDLDVTGAPHTLIGGTTGSGKSTLLHTIICNMARLCDASDMNIQIGDPKQVEFFRYEKLQHVENVATSIFDHDCLIESIVYEMERRFELMKECCDENGFIVDNVIGTKVYMEGKEIKFPNIIVIIDEYGNLIMDRYAGKRINDNLIRIAQKGRAAGINLILATQHPTTEIVNTQIKANCPLRIAMKVMSYKNSEVILDEPGAELLAGNGEMYVNSHFDIGEVRGKRVKRFIKIQGDYISKKEISLQVNNAEFLQKKRDYEKANS